MFSVVIWALLWATVVAPLVFRSVLNSHVKAQGLEDKPPNRSFFFWSESPRRWRGAPTPEKAAPGVRRVFVVVLEQTAMEHAHSSILFKVQPRKFGTTTANMYQGFLSTVTQNVIFSSPITSKPREFPQVTLPLDPKGATPEALEIMEAGAAKAEAPDKAPVEPSVDAVATTAEIEDPVPTMSPQSTPELSTASPEQNSKAHL